MRKLDWLKRICCAVMSVSLLAGVFTSGLVVPVSADMGSLDQHLLLGGRTYYDGSELRLFWTNSGFTFNFTGTGASITAQTNTSRQNWCHLNVYVNGSLVPDNIITINNRGTFADFTLASGLPHGNHTIRVVKRTQAIDDDIVSIGNITLQGEGASFGPRPADPERQIEFVGDSITAGQANLLFTAQVQAEYPGDPNATVTGGYIADGMVTYAGLTSEAFGAANQTLARSGIRFVRSHDMFISSDNPSGNSNSITDEYVKTANLYAPQGNSSEWGFVRPSDVVVINLGTNDNGANVTNTDYTDTDRENYLQSEAKHLIGLVRQNNPDALIVWAYGLMGEPARTADPIKRAVNELTAAGDDNLYYLTLPARNAAFDGIGDGSHPTVTGNIRASFELIKFIADKTGWDYNLRPHLAAQKWWNEWLLNPENVNETASLDNSTQESVDAYNAAIEYADVLLDKATVRDEQMAAAIDLLQASWISLKRTDVGEKTEAYINADESIPDRNASSVITGATTTIQEIDGSLAWKMVTQNHGFGMRVDQDVVGYSGKAFKIDIEYYMPYKGTGYGNTRLRFRYNRVGVSDIPNFTYTRTQIGVEDEWATFTINLTDAEFRRGVDGGTDFNMILLNQANSGDVVDDDVIYVRSVTVTPLDTTDTTDKTELNAALVFDETPFTETSLASESYAKIKSVAALIGEWDSAPEVVLNRLIAAIEAEQGSLRGFGNVTGGGVATVRDIILVRDYILGTAKLSADQKIDADVNEDGVINIFDLLTIRNIILGKSPLGHQ